MTDTENFSLGYVAWGFPAANLRHAKEQAVPAFKVGDRVEVVGPIDEDWECYVSDLAEMIGRSGKITRIVYEAHMVSFGDEHWNFRPENLRHARADDIHARELAAMQAHTDAVERERDKLRIQCDSLELANRFSNKSSIDAFAYTTHLKERLSTVEARADRAEHFVRIIAGLRPGNIGESEAGQLVRTAQATLQPITKAGEA